MSERRRSDVTLPALLFERTPPHSVEAEMSILGTMLVYPDRSSAIVAALPSAEAFYVEAHKHIYSGLLALADRANVSDIASLTDRLAGEGKLADVGGADYLIKLGQSVTTPIPLSHWLDIVRSHHARRRLAQLAANVLHDVYHAIPKDDAAPTALLDMIDTEVAAIGAGIGADSGPRLVADFGKAYMERHTVDQPPGISTGFLDLDAATSGLLPGEFIILAARPAMGKTALAINLAEQIARGSESTYPGETAPVRRSRAVLVYSIEMSGDQLWQRFAASASNLPSQRFRVSKLSNTDFRAALDAMGEYHDVPIWIDETPGITLSRLRTRARAMVNRESVGLIVIDYLGLIDVPTAKNTYERVGVVARGLKQLARELRVPVIALAQLNRGVEGREDKRPNLADLRDSGELEQNADMVWFLHRPEYYHRDDAAWRAQNAHLCGVGELIVAKNRGGPTATARLHWSSSTTRFSNLNAVSAVFP